MRKIRKIILGILLLLLIGAAGAVVQHYRLRAEAERFRGELRQTGWLPELSEIRPGPVPEASNGAAPFLAASARLQADRSLLSSNYYSFGGMHMVSPGRAEAVSRQTVLADVDRTNSWAQISAALQENQAALSQLKSLTRYPVIDFGLPYEMGFDKTNFFLLAHLADLKKACQYLSLAGLNDLHEGNVTEAVNDTVAILKLAECAGNQRTDIGELVGIACSSYAVSLGWEIMQSPEVDEASLAELQSRWERINFLSDACRNSQMEQACARRMLDRWRGSNDEILAYVEMFDRALASMGEDSEEKTAWQKVRQQADIFQWRYWWSYRDEIQYLKGYQILCESTRNLRDQGAYLEVAAVQSNRLKSAGFKLDEDLFLGVLSGNNDLHTLLSRDIPEMVGITKKIAEGECLRRVVVTALALKRYQLRHGHWPDSLVALCPDFLPAVPRDIMVNQPLHYRPLPDGAYRLYSVGLNGVDDGGDPKQTPETKEPSFNWRDEHARDWVWPQPGK